MTPTPRPPSPPGSNLVENYAVFQNDQLGSAQFEAFWCKRRDGVTAKLVPRSGIAAWALAATAGLTAAVALTSSHAIAKPAARAVRRS